PVHGAAVVGAHLGAQLLQVDLAGLLGGVEIAGGGHVQDDVAVGVVGAEQLHGLAELLLVHGALALVVPHVQVGHGGAGLPAGVHVLGDLLGSHGHVGVVGLGGPGAGGGYRDDGLILQIAHGIQILSDDVTPRRAASMAPAALRGIEG